MDRRLLGARPRGRPRTVAAFALFSLLGLLVSTAPAEAQLADIAVAKAGPLLATPGRTLTYAVEVRNVFFLGTATDARVVDDFPAGLSGCSWTCGATAGIASCGAGSGSGNIDDAGVFLGAFAAVRYDVVCSISPSATGALVNTASASPVTLTEIAPGDNTSSIATLLIPEADLSISKTDGSDTATPGGTVTYTLDVANAGPSDATGVLVTDALPPELSGATWTCSASGGATCSPSGTGDLAETVSIPSGAGMTFTLTADVASSATGTLTNTASVSGPAGGTDPDSSNDSATDTSTLVPEGDLSITKTDGATSATPGEAVTYTLVVSNAGPSDSPQVTVSDTFPSDLLNVTWTCVEAGGATCTSAGTGALADTVDLPAGGSVTYAVDATVSADATGTLVNSATVAEGETNDPTPTNNLATDTDTIVRSADLSVTKTDLSDPVLAGGSLLYRITVANAGPSRASGAEVTDLLPTGVTFVSATGDATCLAALDVGTGRDRVTCFFATLAAGGQGAVTVETAVATSVSGTVVNEAVVATAASDDDPDSSNDAATESTEVEVLGDLSLTKTEDRDPVEVGSTLTYTLTVTNAGAGTVSGVALTDSLPAGVSALSATSTQGTCTGAAAALDCSLGTLASGAVATVTLAVRVESSAPASLTNSATVSAPLLTDTDPSNDTATATTTVSRSADLSLTKTAAPSPVAAGSTLRYTFTVTNHGPADAPATVLTDTLPAGTSFLAPVPPQDLIFADGFESGDLSAWSASSPGAASAAAPTPKAAGSCAASGSTVTCALGTLAAGATATVAFDVAVLPTASGSLTNSATVSSGVPDPLPADNSASATVSVVRRIDVGVAIADAPDPVAPGGRLVYTLTVTNAGPATATGVALGDPLPPELSVVDVTPSQGSCTETQEVFCSLGSLGPGASATVTVEVAVAFAASGAITNAAAVVANEVDLNAGNDTDTEITTISP